MGNVFETESMLEMYIYETSQIIEQLEEEVITCEEADGCSKESINKIFRLMHTIKGSSAMMLFDEIGHLAHAMEDLFFYLRGQQEMKKEITQLSDIVLEGIDFIKCELGKIKRKEPADGKSSSLIEKIMIYLQILKHETADSTSIKKTVNEVPIVNNDDAKIETVNVKNKEGDAIYSYEAKITFEPDCGMEDLRAFTVVRNLMEVSEEVRYIPEDMMDNFDAASYIATNGVTIYFKTQKNMQEVSELLQNTIFLDKFEIKELCNEKEEINSADGKCELGISNDIVNNLPQSNVEKQVEVKTSNPNVNSLNTSNQNFISVNVEKLDKLMDLVGEMVVTKAMVTENPEINKLEIESFQKAARQLQKITNEIQDMVMSIRMIPLSATFMKMHRILRDMNKKLDKKVNLVLLGEETEVDKNIIEKISDPLMHLIRNSIDHGIEDSAERIARAKNPIGTITLEARNAGSEVLLTIKDDGQGLNRNHIYEKAKVMGLVYLPIEDMEDKAIYNLILLPGFSTKSEVTEFSGRGVGMDVVAKNIESVGGMVVVDSVEGKGTTITLKIPLTLAIIEGMNIKVGDARYTIPIAAIKESFRPKEKDVCKDPDGNEMILVRGHVYSIIRLHKVYSIQTEITKFMDGILIMVELDDKNYCIFADQLLGVQQVVVKSLPTYFKHFKKIGGVGGCTLLGDGSISLILDVGELSYLSN